MIDPPSPYVMYTLSHLVEMKPPYDTLIFNYSNRGPTELLAIVKDPVQSKLVLRLHGTHWLAKFFFQ